MMDATMELPVRRLDDGIAVIAMHGEITGASDAALTEAYGRVGPDARALLLDFSGLDYMNSSGIGLLVTLLVRANRNRQRLLAFGLSEHYRQILGLTRLDEAIGVHADEASAVAAARAARAARG
jgi:anti-sigma B factor antagonist